MDEETKVKLQESEERGHRAALAFEEIEDAMKALHIECYETFNKSKVQDSEGHKTCRMYLLVLDDVEKRFKKAIRNGDIARRKLLRIKQLSPKGIF